MLKPTLLAALLALASALPVKAEEITLKLSSPAPPRSYMHANVFDGWVDAVEKDSGGTVKIQKFYGGQLGNFGVNYDRVVDGVADVGWTLTAFTGGKFKQQDVAALPFETKDSMETAAALWKIYDKGVTAAEFGKVRLLAMWAFPNAAIHTKEPVKSLEDMKGKKLAVSNATAAKMAILLGATPVTLRPDEVYQAISRGTVEGTIMPYTGMETFKIYEVAKAHLDVALGSDAAALFMNKAVYDKLPPQAKAAIDKHSYAALSQQFGRATQNEAERGRDRVKDAVTTLSAQEEARWKKVLEPIAQEWTQSVPDGEKVLASFREAVKETRAGN